MDFPAALAERKNSFCRLKELFSGKTTIGKMLIKMGMPAEGQIFYNDIPFIEDFSILRHIQESHKDELSVNSCSEGEKKLIEIFRALNKDAELYIFDEPLAYLDKDKSFGKMRDCSSEIKNQNACRITKTSRVAILSAQGR